MLWGGGQGQARVTVPRGRMEQKGEAPGECVCV